VIAANNDSFDLAVPTEQYLLLDDLCSFFSLPLGLKTIEGDD
jgi:hypothetical protein